MTIAGPAGSDSGTKIDYIDVAKLGSLVADFTGTPVSGIAPLTVSFTELSSGDMISWLWKFGDEGSSTDPNPTHVYTSPGTFTVSLTVNTASDSDTLTRSDYITGSG